MDHVVLVGGHESNEGADLVRLAALMPHAVAASPGGRLNEVVAAALTSGATVYVVPMTLGRDPSLIAETARGLSWLTKRQAEATDDSSGGRIAMTAPFGLADHLTSHLRAAANRVASADPRAALVIAAPVGNAHDDADLHRIAHLVRVHGSGATVEVALINESHSLDDESDRLRRLGLTSCVVVEPAFAPRLKDDIANGGPEGMTHLGSLIGDRTILRTIDERVAAARHDLGHGADGIAAGLQADHDHGFAHSHGGADHDHPHTHDGHHHGDASRNDSSAHDRLPALQL